MSFTNNYEKEKHPKKEMKKRGMDRLIHKRRIDTYEKAVNFASNKIEITNKIPSLLSEWQIF